MNKILLSLCPVIILLLSCQSNGKKVVATPAKNTETKKESDLSEAEKLLVGKWRIDSVAEDQQVVNRLITDDTIQAFGFGYGRKFSMLEITSKMEISEPLGEWKTDANRLLITNSAGKVLLEYTYTIQGTVLTLVGTSSISSKNPKKPVFFLSRYLSESDKRILGKP